MIQRIVVRGSFVDLSFELCRYEETDAAKARSLYQSELLDSCHCRYHQIDPLKSKGQRIMTIIVDPYHLYFSIGVGAAL